MFKICNFTFSIKYFSRGVSPKNKGYPELKNNFIE